jgi:hypothetical protein
MQTTITRRRLIGSVSAAAAVGGAGFACSTARAAGTTLTAEPLAHDLVWIRGAGANVLALRDPQGLVFIDGGLAAHAGAVLKLAARELGRGRPHTLVNTH